MSEWISVIDQEPDSRKDILLFCNPRDITGDSNIFVGNIWDKRVYCVLGDGWVPYEYEDITHWMPLPKPPEVKDG